MVLMEPQNRLGKTRQEKSDENVVGSQYFLYFHKVLLKVYSIACGNPIAQEQPPLSWGVGSIYFLVAFFFAVVQSLSLIRLFVTPWTAARQAFLSYTISQSLLKLMSFESVMPFNHLILCHPLLLPSKFPRIRVFSKSQFFASGGQSFGGSASVLPMNIQDSYPLGLTGLISLLSTGLSRIFSNTTVQKHQFFRVQLSLYSNSYIHT